ncbi:MAG: cadherin domain-containing protein, partial [Chloroflexota bacterium]|nr:cadherin domain-containing protein [Chloroflexota bacterium]
TSETATIQARVPVTASLEDDDGVTGAINWQWARSRSSTSGWANISGATSATFTPDDGDIGGYLRATASYNDGEDSGKTAVKVSPRVGQAPPVNSAPAFPATETGTREIAEDATGGTAVGDPVAATDFNGDPLTYSLTGTDAALFTIDSSTGQIRVATGAALDFETKRTLRVTVEVTDGANALGDPDSNAIDDRQNVTITLTDVNEEPVVTGDASISVAENLNRAVATYTGTDPERDTLTWSVDNNDFWISQRGQLHFATPPSYEDGTTHTVRITAEDPEGLQHSLSVTVTVTDVEEQGVVTIQPKRGWDGTRFEAELVDDDNVAGTPSWQWQRSSNRSNWGDISGATSSSYTADADDVNQYLRAVASYEDDRGSGKEASTALDERIADSADQPAANNEPEFADPTAERSVGQGTGAGRNIGAPVRATDPDNGDILTYSLSGSDADLFDIDPGTGQLKTWAVLDFDPDGTNEYSVTVEVHDGFNGSYNPSTATDATITVTITVTQVAQRSTSGGGGGGGGSGGGGGGGGPTTVAPQFVDGSRTARSLDVTAQPGDAVGDPVAATHPNDDDVTYTLSGTNANLFTVDAETGQVRLDEGATLTPGQTYTVNVTATDESGTDALIIVDIEVVDPYDLNGDGAIEKEEAVNAVSDYFAGIINKETVVALLARYFAG